MSFTWLQGTAAGDIIHKADIDEIHTNIDSIKDNLANITYYVTNDATDKGTHNATKYTTHDATQYTGMDSVYYTSNDAGANGVYYSDLNSSIQNSWDSFIEYTAYSLRFDRDNMNDNSVNLTLH
ncbi:hypothetical protein KKH23_10855 [Patescibacteria group bacterium]|nr:hypothetical protein [Patescibacteria group bacterium]